MAVPRSQHSPMFGQLASSQTVWRSSCRISRLSRMYSGLPGGRTISQRGFGWRAGAARGLRPRTSAIGVVVVSATAAMLPLPPI